MKKLILLVCISLITSCSAIDIKTYESNNPQLDLFGYFTGKTTGYGIVQDRKGRLLRQFTVDIVGTIEKDGRLKLYEEFTWADGEESTRTWIITQESLHLYSGLAEDIAKQANGTSYGNVLNWEYQMNLEVDGSTWKIRFDDWMYLVTENILINRAKMSKFGFTVGEITIVFQKNS